MDLRLGFPFTERDDHAVRARVASDLARVAARVADADPALRALLLTGGFSRGEGTFRDGAPVNDYDLVAFRARPGGGALYGRLHRDLSRDVGIEVDLMPVWTARVPRLAPKLFWLDARLGGRVVLGDEAVLARIPAHDPAAVGRREAARLLGNRAAGLLLALPGGGEAPDPAQRDLQATKAVLAAMDARLLHRGAYAARMRDRLALTRGDADHGLYAAAVEWKLTGAKDLPPDWWDLARDALLRAVDETGARDVADGWTERAFHLLRARRLARHPSRDVRREAWRLLAAGGRWPEGGPEWRAAKAGFFARRAGTLQ